MAPCGEAPIGTRLLPGVVDHAVPGRSRQIGTQDTLVNRNTGQAAAQNGTP